MKLGRWLPAVTAMLILGAFGSAGAVVASANSVPCSEDPRDCGLAPTVSNVSVTANRAARATLSSSINPGEQTTTYEVWISYAPCQGGAGECPKPIQKEEVASGSVPYKRTRSVRAKVGMLTPGCTYGYWFVASNGRGTVQSQTEYFVAAGGEPRGPKECGR